MVCGSQRGRLWRTPTPSRRISEVAALKLRRTEAFGSTAKPWLAAQQLFLRLLRRFFLPHCPTEVKEDPSQETVLQLFRISLCQLNQPLQDPRLHQLVLHAELLLDLLEDTLGMGGHNPHMDAAIALHSLLGHNEFLVSQPLAHLTLA